MTDRISGFFWLIFSVVIAIESYRLEIGTLLSPKAGFLPFGASLALGILSLVLLLSVSKRQKAQGEGGLEFNKQRLNKVVFVLISLFAYALLLNTLGFILCTMIFICFLVGVVEPQKWSVIIITTISIPMISYVIFAVWLKVQMPRGFLGF